MEERELENLVILGRAAPDQTKDGRQTLCVGAWSDELGFVRIYPTSIKSNLRRWNVVDVPVERNDKDTRSESWKIKGSSTGWNKLHTKIKFRRRQEREENLELLSRIPKVNCIGELNERQESLGIIVPSKIRKAYLIERKNYSPLVQTTLDEFFDEDIKYGSEVFRVLIKENYRYIPMVDWECPGPCKMKKGYHSAQILDQEVYEWFRKHIDKPKRVWEKVFDNLQLTNDEYQKWFFVGNLNRHRKSFMIISVLRYKTKMGENMQNQQESKKQTALDDFF